MIFFYSEKQKIIHFFQNVGQKPPYTNDMKTRFFLHFPSRKDTVLTWPFHGLVFLCFFCVTYTATLCQQNIYHPIGESHGEILTFHWLICNIALISNFEDSLMRVHFIVTLVYESVVPYSLLKEQETLVTRLATRLSTLR